ncbi:FecCD family ABC transporter permease [Rothia terrae]|jgi:iron complex transport system permease protein|uniref:FecCD family ABC transporter permease n=1 Tax=Rothia terrae TaxID=396015 RepID=UPI0033C7C526
MQEERELVQIRRETWTVLCLLTLVIMALFTLLAGTYQVESGNIWSVLTGSGSALDQHIIFNQRLPRLVAAGAVGASLGLAGAIFQSVSRNPLGSPDVIGFTTGSASGALFIMLVASSMTSSDSTGLPGISIGLGAVLGGFLTAAIVLLLTSHASKNGGTSLGNQMILIGIAVGAMLGSLNDYLLTRADLDAAESAKTWLYGSLNALTWDVVAGPVLLILFFVPATLLLTRRLRILELGDDLASSLGVPPKATLNMLVGAAVLLTALAIMLGGPISFVALIAPQLATRAWKTPGIALCQSSLLGATLLEIADYIAAHALSPFQIPVGLVMGAVGGLYLLIMLIRTR